MTRFIALAAVLVAASSASAHPHLNPFTGTGFVPPEDVRKMWGGNVPVGATYFVAITQDAEGEASINTTGARARLPYLFTRRYSRPIVTTLLADGTLVFGGWAGPAVLDYDRIPVVGAAYNGPWSFGIPNGTPGTWAKTIGGSKHLHAYGVNGTTVSPAWLVCVR